MGAFINQNNERSIARNAAGGVPSYVGLSGNRLLSAVVMTGTVAFALFGFDQGLMSGIIASEQFNREFPATRQSSPTDVHAGTVQGSVTSCYEVGCFFGALFAYFMGEKMGRRRMMILGAFVIVSAT